MGKNIDEVSGRPGEQNGQQAETGAVDLQEKINKHAPDEAVSGEVGKIGMKRQ